MSKGTTIGTAMAQVPAEASSPRPANDLPDYGPHPWQVWPEP